MEDLRGKIEYALYVTKKQVPPADQVWAIECADAVKYIRSKLSVGLYQGMLF